MGIDVASDSSAKRIASALETMAMTVGRPVHDRVQPLDGETKIGPCVGGLVDVFGVPRYVSDNELAGYEGYGLTFSGWYAFVRINAPDGVRAAAGFDVHGAAAKPPETGAGYADMAVRFDAAPKAMPVVINWGAVQETIVFRAVDLAVRNLDSRVTYYVYDINDYATWEYGLTADTAFVDGTSYYTKTDDEYHIADVTAGEAIPADTYYVHTGVTFEGMPRNLSYAIDTIDCPVTFVLPEVNFDGYGAWLEVQSRFTKAVSVTMRVPEGIKMSATGTASISAGVNILTMQYFNSGRVWRLDNTKWADPS